MTEPTFQPYDFTAPLDVEAFLAAIPDGVTALTHGIFGVAALLGEPAKAVMAACGFGPLGRRPAADVIGTYVALARAAFPHAPVRAGLRQVCWNVYPAFKASVIGQGLLVGNERDARAMFEAGATIYANISDGATLRIAERSAETIVMDYANFYSIRAMDVGTFEGMLRAHFPGARVEVAETGPFDGAFRVWFA